MIHLNSSAEQIWLGIHYQMNFFYTTELYYITERITQVHSTSELSI
jgi:hypothetical protein